MKLKFKITFKEYVKLLYGLAYQKRMLRLLVVVAMLLLLWIIFYNLDLFNLPKPLIYQYITLVLIAIVQPLIIFLTIRRNYCSSNQLREPVEMEIVSKEIKINGESYYMEIRLEKLFKIVEKANWFLLYQNNLSAIIIPKKAMNSTDIDKFIKILKDIPNVKIE